MRELRSFAGNEVPQDMQLFQLTCGDEAWCHVYMEAQIFSADSRRLVIHRSAHPHGSAAADDRHAYFMCDLDNGGELRQLTEECGVTAPVLTGEGDKFYYFRDKLTVTGGYIELVSLDIRSGERDVIRHFSGIGGVNVADYFYPLATISADGEHVACATQTTRLGEDGYPEHALWVFDVRTGEVTMPLCGQDYCNLHMQYCRSAARPRDIMVQHNHGCRRRGYKEAINAVAAWDLESGGEMRRVRSGDDAKAQNSGLGIDLHIISDDGGDVRGVPVGRDGLECCQGHQCWRGESENVIVSTLKFITPTTATQELVEATGCGGTGHMGARSGGRRNILTRGVENPHFLHFATDRLGTRLVSDYEADNGEWHLYTGKLGESLTGAAELEMVLNMGSREKSPWHAHPFVSPDGKMVFFNSSQDGTLRPYMAKLR